MADSPRTPTPRANRGAGSSGDEFAQEALRPQQRSAVDFAEITARRLAMTEDHGNRIGALEGQVRGVEQRLTGVEASLSSISTAAARTTGIIEAMDTKLDRIGEKQIRDAAIQEGIALAEARASKAADQRRPFIVPIVSAVAGLIVVAMFGVMFRGLLVLIDESRPKLPHEVSVEVSPK